MAAEAEQVGREILSQPRAMGQLCRPRQITNRLIPMQSPGRPMRKTSVAPDQHRGGFWQEQHLPKEAIPSSFATSSPAVLFRLKQHFSHAGHGNRSKDKIAQRYTARSVLS